MTTFRRNSYFNDEPVSPIDQPLDKPYPVEAITPGLFASTAQAPRDHIEAPTVSAQVREDWAYRIRTAADEAGDANKLELESDLLDLRDDILRTI